MRAISTRIFPILWPAVCALVLLPSAAHAILFVHNETVTNGTGATANDITLELPRPALVAPGKVSIASTAFFGPGATAVGANTTTVTITGAPGQTVANGGSMNVGWFSGAATDLLLNTSFWTSNGTNIGPATTNNAISWNINGNGNGTITVALNNPGPAVSFTSLAVNNGVSIDFFAADTAESNLSTGSVVALLIASQGTLATGITDVATFMLSATGYAGENIVLTDTSGAMCGISSSCTVDLFLGESQDVSVAVPEPSSLLLLAASLLGLVGLRRRPARRASTRLS